MKSLFDFLKGLLLAALPCFAYGQSINDTLFLANSITTAKSIYEKQMAGEGPLFNGVQYREIILHSYDEGHPFFLSDDWITGSINYDNILFDSVDVQYDLVNQKIIIDHPISHFKLQLIDEKIGSLSLSNHMIVRLTIADPGANLKSGYYELLYNGKNKVYAAHKKIRLEKFDANLIKQVFEEKTQFYVYKDGIYHPVKSKRSVLNVFENKKTMMRKYLHKNKISFRKNSSFAITQAARFYEESDNQP